MVADVFLIINQGLSQVNSWFDSLLNATGFYAVVIGLVVLIIFFRLVIFPLLGSYWHPTAGSDRVTETTSIRGKLQPDGSVYYDPGDAVITRTFVHRGKK